MSRYMQKNSGCVWEQKNIVWGQVMFGFCDEHHREFVKAAIGVHVTYTQPFPITHIIYVKNEAFVGRIGNGKLALVISRWHITFLQEDKRLRVYVWTGYYSKYTRAFWVRRSQYRVPHLDQRWWGVYDRSGKGRCVLERATEFKNEIEGCVRYCHGESWGNIWICVWHCNDFVCRKYPFRKSKQEYSKEDIQVNRPIKLTKFGLGGILKLSKSDVSGVSAYDRGRTLFAVFRTGKAICQQDRQDMLQSSAWKEFMVWKYPVWNKIIVSQCQLRYTKTLRPCFQI